MEKMEKKAIEYRKVIEQKQNLALLIEATNLLKMQSIKTGDYNNDFIHLEKNEGYSLDIAQNIFINFFPKLLDKLVECNFIIDLKDANITGFYKDIKIMEEKKLPVRELIELYERMETSYYYIEKYMGVSRIDFISLLIEKRQYDIVMELLISSKLTDCQKFRIMDLIIQKYPNYLLNICKTIPSPYHYYQLQNNENSRQEFKQQLDKTLHQIFNVQENYAENIIRKQMKSDCGDEVSLHKVKDVVEFFVEHNLVNMNEIVWNYENTEITSAAAAYVMGNKYLAKYLYCLPDYLKNSSEIKSNSDKAIMERIIKYQPRNLKEFINQPNYENTAEKLYYVVNLIHEKGSTNFSKKEYNDIIKELLKKTKKEEYKKLKQDYEKKQKELIDSKERERLLILKRQELTTTLAILNQSLLEQVPAKKKIKEIKWNRK